MAIATAGQLNLDGSPPWGSRGLDCFEKLEQIGEGTYGQVFMAKETKTGEIVALKMIKMDNEKQGFPITAIREIKILKKLRHQNIINLKEIVTSPVDGNKYKGNIYMVFEYMDHDLTGLSNRPGIKFTIPQIKCYMRQLLTGLHYCHVNQILHRDIKCSNLLIDNKGNLKLADFGLARFYSQNANLTNHVITLWYRPPELLLKSTKYGPQVDMWSVGCIFAELLHGKPILPGKNELDQLTKIYELCGTPDDVSMMPGGDNMKPPRKMKRRLREVFKHFDCFALDLLDKMLALNPKERISAKDALDAEYFWADPLPCHPKSLPKYESSHEFQTKKRQKLCHSQNPVHGGPNLPPVHHGPANAHLVHRGPTNAPPVHGRPNAPLVHRGPNVPLVHRGPVAPPGYDRPNVPSVHGGPNTRPVHRGPNVPPAHGGPDSRYNEPSGRPSLQGRGHFCKFG